VTLDRAGRPIADNALDMVTPGEHVDSPQTIYRARADAFNAEWLALSRRFNLVANLRLATFVLAAACLIWGIAGNKLVGSMLGVTLGVAFVGLVHYHSQLGRRRSRVSALRDINLESIERLARRWDRISLRHRTTANPRHPYAADLDLFGRASLLHLLDTTRTSMGQSTLTDWILHAASPDTVRARQIAMTELATKLDFRQELEVSAGPRQGVPIDPAPLLAWAESTPPRLGQALLWAARISPALLCVSAAAQAAGSLSWPIWLAFLFVNIAIWQVLGQRAYATLSHLGVREAALRQYATSFDLLSTPTTIFAAPLLGSLLAELHANGRSAARGVHALERIARCVIPRSALVYWFVQVICLWDLHVLAAVVDWQTMFGQRLRVWLAVLGEIEALAALASLAHAHPDWELPEIDSTTCRLTAEQAGHPLLDPGARVDNPITLGPAGTFVLVTGSNMAGKSTYLRTIGTNIVLAQAGGPVCARAFRMPPLRLCTSMRVVDSLEHGVSTFLAEVARLKQVVDVVREANGAQAVCYLLDEILQGTNSAERQIAVRQAIHFLVDRRAIGAVSTHDLALADLPELGARAQLVHFQETLTDAPAGPLMSFGYRLQPGLATSTNALRLVAMLGLDDESAGS
jgi:MutS domain V